MKAYRITNRTSGQIMGTYEGGTEEEALLAMVQDGGAESIEDREDWTVEEVEMRWRVGDRVEAGEIAEDYDTGTVVSLHDGSGTVGCSVEVAWDSGVKTPADCDMLRPEGERPIKDEEATA